MQTRATYRYYIIVVMLFATMSTAGAAPGGSGEAGVTAEQSGGTGASTERGISRDMSIDTDRSKSRSHALEQARSRTDAVRREIPAAAAIVPAMATQDGELARCAKAVMEPRRGWPGHLRDGWSIDEARASDWARQMTRCALMVSAAAQEIAADFGVTDSTELNDQIRQSILDYRDTDIPSDLDSNLDTAVVTLDTSAGGPPAWTIGAYQVEYGHEGLHVARGTVQWYGGGVLNGESVTIAVVEDFSHSIRDSAERGRSTSAGMTQRRNTGRRADTSAEGRQGATTGARGTTQ